MTLFDASSPSVKQIARALRLPVSDPRDYLVTLATLLAHCVPAHTDVVCLSDATFGTPARITHLRVNAGATCYTLRVDSSGRLCASRHEGGTSAVVAEMLPLHVWIDALAADLAHAAQGSAVLRRAVTWLAA